MRKNFHIFIESFARRKRQNSNMEVIMKKKYFIASIMLVAGISIPLLLTHCNNEVKENQGSGQIVDVDVNKSLGTKLDDDELLTIQVNNVEYKLGESTLADFEANGWKIAENAYLGNTFNDYYILYNSEDNPAYLCLKMENSYQDDQHEHYVAVGILEDLSYDNMYDDISYLKDISFGTRQEEVEEQLGEPNNTTRFGSMLATILSYTSDKGSQIDITVSDDGGVYRVYIIAPQYAEVEAEQGNGSDPTP